MTELWSISLLSVKVAALGVAIAFVPALALGRWLAPRSSAGVALLRALVNLPIVLPPVAVGLLLLQALSPHHPPGSWLARLSGESWILTTEAAALAAAVMGFPLLVQGVESGFRRVSARDERLAAAFGASRLRILWSVAIPIASRGILTGVALAFARGLGESAATTMVAGRIAGETETLALALYDRYEQGDLAGAWWFALVSVGLGGLVLLLVELVLKERQP